MDDLFRRVIGYVLEDEGVHDEDDAVGGDTWFGLARRYHPDMHPWPPSRAQAIERYHQIYWRPYRLDELPEPVAYAVFDGIVQHDRSAIRILQTCVGTKVDGILGSRTIAGVRGTGVDRTLITFLASRARYYAHLPNFPKEGQGWFNRLFKVHARCLRWATPSSSTPS